ncbi:MAG: VOC family protein [Bacteroidota bacterium]
MTLSIAELKPTVDFMTDTFGFTIAKTDGNYTRLYGNDGDFAGNYVDIRHDQNAARGHNGIGTVHHVAWRLESDEALAAMRNHLVEDLGFKVTDFKDRNYFHSIYFRMPGHVLFEIATVPPGFTVDETSENLGETLKLPEWEEVNRTQIESVLPKFR